MIEVIKFRQSEPNSYFSAGSLRVCSTALNYGFEDRKINLLAIADYPIDGYRECYFSHNGSNYGFGKVVFGDGGGETVLDYTLSAHLSEKFGSGIDLAGVDLWWKVATSSERDSDAYVMDKRWGGNDNDPAEYGLSIADASFRDMSVSFCKEIVGHGFDAGDIIEIVPNGRDNQVQGGGWINVSYDKERPIVLFLSPQVAPNTIIEEKVFYETYHFFVDKYPDGFRFRKHRN
jgi:hypothetical protein